MIWYPYQQMKTMQTPYEIVDAEGVYLYTRERRMIDSVSSWWSVIHGYKHPALNQVLVDQAGRFSHVMLGGLTHAPAQQLAEKLGQLASGGTGVQLLFRLRQCGGGGGSENGSAIFYEPGRADPAHHDSGSGARLPRGHLQDHGGRGRRGLPLCPPGLRTQPACGAHSHGDSGAGGGLSDLP